MSSSAKAEASVPKEDKGKKAFVKALSRFKTVLKRGESSKRQSTIAPAADVATTKPTTTAKPKPDTAKTRYVINFQRFCSGFPAHVPLAALVLSYAKSYDFSPETLSRTQGLTRI